MALVLGICSSHDASACVFRDGELVAAISEERISRIKSDGGHLPNLAIDACLAMAGAKRTDVDHIATNYCHVPEVYCRRPELAKEIERRLSRAWKELQGKRSNTQYFLNEVLKHIRDKEPTAKFSDFWREAKFLRDEGYRADCQVHFVDHHMTHATAAAFYAGFDEAAVISMDGEGDLGMHHTSGVFKDGKITISHVSETPGCSPGFFYMDVTEHLGFRPLRHEGKVLGLAAYGDPQPLADAFRRAMRLSADGHGLDSDFADMDRAVDHRKIYIGEAMRGHTRENVAAAAQTVFEETIVALVRNFLVESGQRKLAVNGGVFANVKLNQRIAALPECESLFVFPGMSDTGNSVGAALMVLDRLQPGYLRERRHVLETVYWGPEPTPGEIRSELDARGLAYEELGVEAVTEKTAQAIHSGQVIGWFQGAMEFGPRALGNRSMVAAPTDKSINDWFNARLERSEFMPFAPSALAEYADEVFENVEPGRHAAEFMTITFDVKKAWQPRIPAVVHVDGTARPQLVRRDRNPRYWALIERYRQLSGIPLILNTSFNVHEEPIVCGPQEAVQAVVDQRVDHLAIGPFWVDGAQFKKG
ncbi:MAG: carbamoyltransferase [Burkholderiales bacterium]